MPEMFENVVCNVANGIHINNITIWSKGWVEMLSFMLYTHEFMHWEYTTSCVVQTGGCLQNWYSSLIL